MNQYDTHTMQHLNSSPVNLEFASPSLERVALACGMNTLRLSRSFFLVQHPDLNEWFGFAGGKSSWTGVPTRRISDNKDITRTFFQSVGVRVPRGELFEPGQVENALKYAESLAVPVVVKPRSGGHGTGVMTDLNGLADISRAVDGLERTKYRDQPFIVEEFIAGNDYRILVVGDKVVSVVLRQPCSVVGDGQQSVTELVDGKNRIRRQNPHARNCLIAFNDDATYWLQKERLTPKSVPEAGRKVRLGSAGNVAAGGDSIEVLDECDDGLLNWAVEVVHAMPGLDHAGIDVICDHKRSVRENEPVLLEVNPNAALSLHLFPIFGMPRDVASEVFMRSCALAGFDPGAPRRELAVRIEIEGDVGGVGYEDWFGRMANERGVGGSIRSRDGGCVEAKVTGKTADVWALASGAIVGPRGALVHCVTTTHVSGVRATDRFEVCD